VKYIWNSQFPGFISTNKLIWNDSLVFKYPVKCKIKTFQILYIFIEMKVNVWLFFFVHLLMTSIIFHTRRPNSIKRQLRTRFLCFSWCSFFAFWGAEKHVFHFTVFCPTRYVLECFRCLDVSNRVTNWNKVKYLVFVQSISQICQCELPIFI